MNRAKFDQRKADVKKEEFQGIEARDGYFSGETSDIRKYVSGPTLKKLNI